MVRNRGDGHEIGCPSPLERVLQRPWSRLDGFALVGLSAMTLGVFLAVLRFYGEPLARLTVGERLFQADGWRVVSDMIDFSGPHGRVSVHPLFPLPTMPLTNLLIRFLGVSRLGAIWIFNAAVAVAFINLLYVTQRNLDCPRRSSILVCSLALVSSSFLFWFVVPETYPLGALSLLVCFAVAALATRAPVSRFAFTAANIFSMGITVTNWMAGLALLAAFRPLRNAAVAAAAAFVVVMGCWSIERAVFPQPPGLFFSPNSVRGESEFLFHPESGGSKAMLRGELLSPVVLPPVHQTTRVLPTGRALSVQGFSDILESPLGTAAGLGWMTLLGFGVVALARGPAPGRFRWVLGSVLAGQIVLHLIYGEETFLYALHFLPILLLVVAMSTLTRWRPLVEVLLVPTILLVLWNNIGRLDETVQSPFHGEDPRLQVLSEPLSKGWEGRFWGSPRDDRAESSPGDGARSGGPIASLEESK